MDEALIKIMSVIDDDKIRNNYNINEYEYSELSKYIANKKNNIDRIKLIKRIYYIYNDVDITNSILSIKLKKDNAMYDFYNEDNFNIINNNLPYYLDLNKEKKNINFKCNCLNRLSIKNIDLNQSVYVYKIEDIEFFNSNLISDDDF